MGGNAAHDDLCDVVLGGAEGDEDDTHDGDDEPGVGRPEVFAPGDEGVEEGGHEEDDDGALEGAGEEGVEGVLEEADAKEPGGEEGGGADAGGEADHKHSFADVAVEEVTARFDLALVFLHPPEFDHPPHREADGEVHEDVADEDAEKGRPEGNGAPEHFGTNKGWDDGPTDDVFEEEGGEGGPPTLNPGGTLGGFNKGLQFGEIEGDGEQVHQGSSSSKILSGGMLR